MSIHQFLIPSKDKHCQAEQIRLLMEQTNHGLIGAIPGIFLVAWVLYADSPPLLLSLWVVSMVSMLSFRLWWNAKWLKKAQTDEKLLQLIKPLLTQTTLSGFLWASVIFIMPSHLDSQLIVLGMACLLTMGSTISLASYLPAYATVVMPTMLSQCLWFIAQGDHISIVAGSSALLLTVALTLMTAQLQRNIIKNINLKFENISLVDDLHALKDALEHAAEPITIFTADGTLKYANPAFSYLTGFKMEYLEDKHWDDLYVDLYAARKLFTQDGHTLSGLPWSGELEVKTTHEDLAISCGFSPVRSSTGEVKELINIQRDVREGKMMQQRLEKLNRMEALSLMAASIAHDFNNILTAIVGNAQLTKMQSKGNDKALTSVERIIRSTTRATGLCKQMLAYSGKGSFVIRELKLNDIISDMKKTLDKSTGQQYAISLNAPDSLPSFEGDDVQIRQMIMNLTLNAGEALGGKEDGVISFEVKASDYSASQLKSMHAGDQGLKEGQYIQLTISDNGEGMDQKSLEKAYEPFFSTRFVGRGLGLSAVHGIVRAHNAGINIVSEIAVGTSVTVIFPSVS